MEPLVWCDRSHIASSQAAEAGGWHTLTVDFPAPKMPALAPVKAHASSGSSSPPHAPSADGGAVLAGLNALGSVLRSDATLRDSLESLVGKERRLAELELLRNLSAGGFFAANGGSGRAGGGVASSPVARLTGAHAAPSSADAHAGEGGDASPSAHAAPASARALAALAAVYDATDPLRVVPSALETRHGGASRMLRPASGRAEVTSAEAALLFGAVDGQVRGLDISHMPCDDAHVGAAALSALASTLTAAWGGDAARATHCESLDARRCEIGATAVASFLELFRAMPRLVRVSRGDSVACAAAVLAHPAPLLPPTTPLCHHRV